MNKASGVGILEQFPKTSGFGKIGSIKLEKFYQTGKYYQQTFFSIKRMTSFLKNSWRVMYRNVFLISSEALFGFMSF
jgi:hypothetical protein